MLKFGMILENLRQFWLLILGIKSVIQNTVKLARDNASCFFCEVEVCVVYVVVHWLSEV